jgi:hypothetical protein
MKRFLLVLFCVVFVAGTPSSAAVFERDWKTPGDGLLTYDDVNQREWLDLTETFVATGPQTNYEAVLDQISTGGLFAGFSVAISQDVIALAASASINTGTLDFNLNQESTGILIALLGETVATNQGGPGAFGLLDEYVPPLNKYPSQMEAAFQRIPGLGVAGLSLFRFENLLGDDRPDRFASVYLYRNAVPEQDGIAIAALSVVLSLSPRSYLRCIEWRSSSRTLNGTGLIS